MTRTIFGKVMWAGRVTVFLVGLAVTLALVLGVATMALAGTGIGATFNLGEVNTVEGAVSKLVGRGQGVVLSLDNNGSGSALDLKVGATNAAPDTKTTAPMKVDSAAKVTNLNADKLDGMDSTEFAIRTDHSIQSTADCDTPNTWNLCAPVTLTVPAGKRYYVSVWSSFTAKAGANAQDVAFCSGGRGPGIDAGNPCITPWGIHSRVTIEAGQLGAAASSGETIPLSEGEYTFGTAISPPTEQFASHEDARVITKVMVRSTANSF